METSFLSNNLTPLAIGGFICLFFVISTVIAVMLLVDGRKRQRLYRRFKGNLTEYIVILSPKLEFLNSMPIFMNDPFFDKLSQGFLVEEILDSGNFNRMKTYLSELEKHQGMPFLFSLETQDNSNGIKQNKTLWYEMRVSIDRMNPGEFYFVCLIKNITRENEFRKERDEARESLESLLQNTGDFLWTYDVENRSMRLNTPLMDSEHRTIPRSVGLVDLPSMMPESDYALFDQMVNKRVMDYQNYGSVGDPFKVIKVRLYGPNRSPVWYGFRGKLVLDNRGRLVFQGSARRIDKILDNVIENKTEADALISAALEFPDIRIFWLDRAFNLLGCNQAFANAMQINNIAEAVGKNLENVAKHKYMPFISRNMQEAFAQGRSMSWKGGFDNDSSLLMFNIVPLRDEHGEMKSAMGVYLLLDSRDFDKEVSL